MTFPIRSNCNLNMSMNQKLLLGLGKATKRGIKKCSNCGMYNGSRSTMCKNKECGNVLKDPEEKSKVDLDAVRLLTGTEKQVFSVRVRDMGSNSRGFVQLPLLQSPREDDTNIFSEVALCFVDSCQNSFDNSILKCHEEDQNGSDLLCIHIKSSLKSQSTASPLELKKDVPHSFNICNDFKENLLLIESEKEGFLVQRVSKSVMAVKCQVSPKHPLGYLHFTFLTRKDGESFEEFYCSCGKYLGSDTKQCIHYYACIWAVASNHKLYNEFSYFIQKELPLVMSVGECLLLNNLDSLKKVNIKNQKAAFQNEDSTTKLLANKTPKKIAKIPKKKLLSRKCAKIIPKILPIEIKVITEVKNSDEGTYWPFLDWLSFVTESINQTMQFDNYGIVNTLRFLIPEIFFLCLIKKIPSQYEATHSEMSLTYTIMNILHLKSIFDTPQIKLKLSKKFVHNDQKGYIEYNENEEYNETYMCSFIFFLNVGPSTVDESDDVNNAFIIEWIPSQTTITKVGELKLHYKYGRKST